MKIPVKGPSTKGWESALASGIVNPRGFFKGIRDDARDDAYTLHAARPGQGGYNAARAAGDRQVQFVRRGRKRGV